MNKLGKLGLTAAALLACAPAASATTLTITQTLSFGPQRTAWTHTFSFAPFDTALGTLTMVTDTQTETLTGTVEITNDGPTSASFTAFITDSADTHFTGLTPMSETFSNTVSRTLAPGATTGMLTLTGTSTATATTTSGFAGFESGPVLGAASDVGALSFASPDTDNATVVFTDTGEVVDRLVYTYIVKTPEPAVATLLGTALAGLAAARRRRRP